MKKLKTISAIALLGIVSLFTCNAQTVITASGTGGAGTRPIGTVKVGTHTYSYVGFATLYNDTNPSSVWFYSPNVGTVTVTANNDPNVIVSVLRKNDAASFRGFGSVSINNTVAGRGYKVIIYYTNASQVPASGTDSVTITLP